MRDPEEETGDKTTLGFQVTACNRLCRVTRKRSGSNGDPLLARLDADQMWRAGEVQFATLDMSPVVFGTISGG